MEQQLRKDLFDHMAPHGMQDSQLKEEAAVTTLQKMEEEVVEWGVPEGDYTKKIDRADNGEAKEVKIGKDLGARVRRRTKTIAERV